MGYFKNIRIARSIRERDFRELERLVNNDSDEKSMLYYAFCDSKVNYIMLIQTMKLAQNEGNLMEIIYKYKQYIYYKNPESINMYYDFVLEVINSKEIIKKLSADNIKKLKQELQGANNVIDKPLENKNEEFNDCIMENLFNCDDQEDQSFEYSDNDYNKKRIPKISLKK